MTTPIFVTLKRSPQRGHRHRKCLTNAVPQAKSANGHTNGDAFVAFPAHRVVHTGDIFASKAVPLVDTNNGGSMLQIADTLRKAHAGIPNVTTIINGHTAAQSTWADLREFADFNADLVAWARAGLKAGKTPEQLAAEWKVPEKYKNYSSTVSAMMGGLAGRIQGLQKELP